MGFSVIFNSGIAWGEVISLAIGSLIFMFVPVLLVGCKKDNGGDPPPVEPEVLSVPQNLRVQNGIIIFSAVIKAEYYTIVIDDLTFEVYPETNDNVEVVGNLIKYDANRILTVAEDYNIQVKACSSSIENSELSSVVEYTHVKKIKEPENVKINGTILTWDHVENAKQYIIKVQTPQDSILYDMAGNVLPDTSLESVSKAYLTEFKYVNNMFDFSSLIKDAGEYNFFLCAEFSEDFSHANSSYVRAGSYKNFISLETPQNIVVEKDGNTLYLTTVTDKHTTQLIVACGEFKNIINVKETSDSFTKDGNILKINLNRLFEDVAVEGEHLDFTKVKTFEFTTQAKREENASVKYYTDSEISEKYYFNNYTTLSEPVGLKLEYSDLYGEFIASWDLYNEDDLEHISGYKVIVARSAGIEEYNLEPTKTNCNIGNDVISVAIKVLGSANYESSELTTFVSNYSEQLGNWEIVNTDSELSWGNVADYYIVEIGDECVTTIRNKFTVDTTDIKEKDYRVKVTAIKNGYISKTKQITIQQSEQLATPTFAEDGSALDGYTITFAGDENAIGYFVYLSTNNGAELIKIDGMFSSTTINLLPYIISQGKFANYEVRIQAVASVYSKYQDSNLSEAIKISYAQAIPQPELYKVNGNVAPIVKTKIGQETKYYLNFYGVKEALGYEVLINYNKKDIPLISQGYEGLYKVDITEYFASANVYNIKLRANASATGGLGSSEFVEFDYELIQQLTPVSNVKVVNYRGNYTLSFDEVKNANQYKVRIVKVSDYNYANYLSLMQLPNPFIVTGATDVTDYFIEKGLYYVYVIASSTNASYVDSAESSSYGVVDKLESLHTPKNIQQFDVSKDVYNLTWEGDVNADYYTVTITNPNNISFTHNVYGSTTTNISQYLTVQGKYVIKIGANINPAGEKIAMYTDSASALMSLDYKYQLKHDFERYSVTMYGEEYNFVIDNINTLKNILWYHLINDIDNLYNLNLYLLQDEDDYGRIDTLKQTIIKLAGEAVDLELYNFNEDEVWIAIKEDSNTTEEAMFAYLCEKIISTYPDMYVLKDLDESSSVKYIEVIHDAESPIFGLYYKNELNNTKQRLSSTLISTGVKYSNTFNYLAKNARRNINSPFAVDTYESVEVSNTEQLLHAVMNGKKPNFVGDSQVAETVYKNAKHVLASIITDRMTDVQKVTAIFDWIEYAYTLNYYADKKMNGSTVVSAAMEEYGLVDQFYLEGIFASLNREANGGFDGEFYLGQGLATNSAYVKAFSLLCGIEGIESVIVKGYYLDGEDKISHQWNKVKISTPSESFKNWYALDITFSDNDIIKKVDIASHNYFLVTDNFLTLQLGLIEDNSAMSLSVKGDYEQAHRAIKEYNIYQNITIALSAEEIESLGEEFGYYSAFEYSKFFVNGIFYQSYQNSSYSQLEKYMFNMLLNACNNKSENSFGGVIEFQIRVADNGNSTTFDSTIFDKIVEDAKTKYSIACSSVSEVRQILNSSSNTITVVLYVA